MKKYTHEDCNFIVECLRDGVLLSYLAEYVYGVTSKALRDMLYRRNIRIIETRLDYNHEMTALALLPQSWD